MYIPQHFEMPSSEVRDLLQTHGAGELITATPEGLRATLLPFMFDEQVGEHGALQGHVARNNDQWRHPSPW